MNLVKLIRRSRVSLLIAAMSPNRAAGPIAAMLAATLVIVVAPLGVPAASADPCPDIEVVFARGTGEAPGVGQIGQAFVDALRAQADPRSVDVYPVDYAAGGNFDDRMELARTFVDGIRNAASHIQDTATRCPNTRVVLGGYSQGAALAGYTTSASIPREVPAEYVSYIPKPMARKIAEHVSAVVLIARPSNQFLTHYGAPPITIGSAYAAKTIDLCTDDDAVCNGDPDGQPGIPHLMYGANGMVDQGASFAVSHL